MYLFTVPAGNKDRAEWPPTLLVDDAKATDDLIQGDCSRCRITGSQNLHTSGQSYLPRAKYHAHTQATLSLDTSRGREIYQRTIAVITDYDNLVLDVTRDVSHHIPNWRDFRIDYVHKQSEIGQVQR